MVMLLRSMAPQVIAVDEIGNYEDIRAIEMTLNSGCKLLATVHGSSIDEIRKKPLLERLIKEHVFERYIILQKETAGKIGKVREIYDERGTCLYQRQRYVCYRSAELCWYFSPAGAWETGEADSISSGSKTCRYYS